MKTRKYVIVCKIKDLLELIEAKEKIYTQRTT